MKTTVVKGQPHLIGGFLKRHEADIVIVLMNAIAIQCAYFNDACCDTVDIPSIEHSRSKPHNTYLGTKVTALLWWNP